MPTITWNFKDWEIENKNTDCDDIVKWFGWQNEVLEIEELKKKIGTVGFERFRLCDNVIHAEENKIRIPEINKREFIITTHKILCHAGAEKVKKHINSNFDIKIFTQTIKDTILECKNKKYLRQKQKNKW